MTAQEIGHFKGDRKQPADAVCRRPCLLRAQHAMREMPLLAIGTTSHHYRDIIFTKDRSRIRMILAVTQLPTPTSAPARSVGDTPS